MSHEPSHIVKTAPSRRRSAPLRAGLERTKPQKRAAFEQSRRPGLVDGLRREPVPLSRKERKQLRRGIVGRLASRLRIEAKGARSLRNSASFFDERPYAHHNWIQASLLDDAQAFFSERMGRASFSANEKLALRLFEAAACVGQLYLYTDEGLWDAAYTTLYPHSTAFVRAMCIDPEGQCIERCFGAVHKAMKNGHAMMRDRDDAFAESVGFFLDKLWGREPATLAKRQAFLRDEWARFLRQKIHGLRRDSRLRAVADVVCMAATHDEAWAIEAVCDGRDVKTKDADGWTALMRATEAAGRTGSAACVERLLPHSDPDARNAYGCNALMMAARNGSAECVRLLAPVTRSDARDDKGLSALMWAAQRGHVDGVRLLLSHNDPAAVDENGVSALMMVNQDQHDPRVPREERIENALAILRALLPVSDALAENTKGQNALGLATGRQDCAIADFLASSARFSREAEDAALERLGSERMPLLMAARARAEAGRLAEAWGDVRAGAAFSAQPGGATECGRAGVAPEPAKARRL